MSKAKRQIKLGAFLMETGHHIAAWRHPDTHLAGGLDFPHYAELAQIAERAKFDAVFFADSVGIRDTNLASLSRTARADHFEPLTLLAALSVVTKNIGLIATVSTTFNEPFNVARKFASLDHLSGGRSGWNLVTSSSETEALNFGFEQHPAHAVRYERAREFYDVVAGLWDSWEDDAFIRNRESGIYFDPEKLHTLDHRGPDFKVRGPLNVARSPQGWPVVVQAGASDAGRELAAQTAEVIFVAHQTLDEAKAFYQDVKGRLTKYGRQPDDLKIMPGIFPVIGRTQEEARAKFNALQDLIHPDVGLALLSKMTGGVDLSKYPVDGPLPEACQANCLTERQSWSPRRSSYGVRGHLSTLPPAGHSGFDGCNLVHRGSIFIRAGSSRDCPLPPRAAPHQQPSQNSRWQPSLLTRNACPTSGFMMRSNGH
jgi:FMN-dependent oxidoreductase (nitrilotriacetate monooxygenase family)